MVLTLIMSVSAQNSIGVKGGVNFAAILGETISGINGRTSFNAGIFIESELTSISSVQLEVLFSGQGFTTEEHIIRGGIFDGESLGGNTFSMDYLNIPMLYKYYVNKGFYVEAGAQLGFLVSAKVENDITIGEVTNRNSSSNFRDNLTAASFDLIAGIGYKFDSGIGFSARYTYGLTDIWRGAEINDDYYYDYYYYYYDYGKRNSVFQLNASYQLPF